MDEQQWRPTVNGVLYQTQFAPTLDDEQLVARGAREVVERPLVGRSPQTTLDALRSALASGKRLTGSIPQPHDEDAVRSFLTRLADRLEASRPWPVPPYRVLSWKDRPDVLDAPAVARVGFDWKPAADRLRTNAEQADDRAVVVVELSTGDVLAIVDDWDLRAGLRDGQSVLLSASPGPDVLDAFRAATGFTDAEVTPV
ncbi:MAG TPA: hypothetical protein VLM05_21270 [Mycobacteriales bacterium]|nr:hypothetical protein [Mycobacteriales bacterium]